MTKGYKPLIGGDWVEGSDGTYPIINPATEEIVGEAPEASVADAEAAAAAAREAQPKWAAVPREEGARLLQAVADRVRASGRAGAVDHLGDGGHPGGRLGPAGADGWQPLRARRGFKMSGVRRPGGHFGRHAYTEIQSIMWPA